MVLKTPIKSTLHSIHSIQPQNPLPSQGRAGVRSNANRWSMIEDRWRIPTKALQPAILGRKFNLIIRPALLVRRAFLLSNILSFYLARHTLQHLNKPQQNPNPTPLPSQGRAGIRSSAHQQPRNVSTDTIIGVLAYGSNLTGFNKMAYIGNTI